MFDKTNHNWEGITNTDMNKATCLYNVQFILWLLIVLIAVPLYVIRNTLKEGEKGLN